MNRTANARSNQKRAKRRRRERRARRDVAVVAVESVRSKLRAAAADVARDAWEREAMGRAT